MRIVNALLRFRPGRHEIASTVLPSAVDGTKEFAKANRGRLGDSAAERAEMDFLPFRCAGKTPCDDA